jgi:mono/diheme cytochrome c family protein
MKSITDRRPWRAVAAAAAALLLCGCAQDMANQPRYNALAASRFFKDGLAYRPLPEGVVARNDLRDDEQLYTGKVNGDFAATFPFPVTREVIDRGEERYNIYCAPCHGLLGDGDGMVVQRGFRQPPSYHTDRLREAQPGYFFDVITNGFGAMSDFRTQVPVKDRWAIVAYIRALQRSQHATVADAPEWSGSKEARP